ncbi:teashirt homolog 3 [Manis pentadactyla]|uniref:teashirt homolog 3 n=1 Tax=Manis pentadactyla TaxID=143292 RepID=UPI00255D0355|nr:teashirt homolog 3 [Manis pentadactyla]XP_036785721.2 teashirt homolog 3 [Manis pentadactyla]XP_036785722.2 teashirt homolog 3 [Manis pentadactyla]
MPRRKQQAPRRAAAYVSDELKAAALVDEDADAEEGAADGEPAAKYACAETELGRTCPSCQNSPAAELSGHDMDSESHISETSDRMADFESGSVKNEEEAKEAALPPEDPAASDSLEQMKAVYNSFLSSSYWSGLQLGPRQAPSGDGGSSSGSSSSGSSSDWHRSAVARSLQQAPPGRALPEPGLFSTVQLYRQSSRLYGSIFTGASKFRCKDCSAAYDTLVELTVHMNETGHYRDDNHDADHKNPRRWSKPRKRSLLEMEGKEDAQKVLKCMYCGHSFESLQDLSVHMIKTKHYQKVPLKEPVTPVAAKIVPATRKKASLELELPSSPDSTGGTPKAAVSDSNDVLQKNCNPYITPNNRYGHQNGASYAWHFEARKSQILKCMECGSSHDTLQELTAHMMVTGHFIKVTNSAMKKGKPIMETPVTPTITTLLDEKVQSVPLAATTFTSPSSTPVSVSPKLNVEVKKEVDKEKVATDEKPKEKEKPCEEEEKYDISSKYHYLTENDLEESPKGGLDILKSLENTVTSAINKAQNGTPSWGGYPSIHAAYQLPNMMKLSLGSSGKSTPLKPVFGNSEIVSPTKNQTLISPPSSQTSPMPKTNFHAMEELVKKVTEKVAKVEEKMKEPEGKLSPPKRATPSPCSSEVSEPIKMEASSDVGFKSQEDSPSPQRDGCKEGSPPAEPAENGKELVKPMTGSLSSTAIITDHPPEQPFVNPLSALQSVMNIHLGKAAKPSLPALDPMSMLFKMSNSLAEKAAVATPPPLQSKKVDHLDRYFYHVSNDQPIDLTKGKSDKGCSLGSVLLSPTSASPATSSPTVTTAKTSAVVSFMSNSPLRENALSDISDMLKNLTESHTSKSSTPSSISEKSDIDGATLEDAEEATPAQKRKGRQSNWNPQHLLILQAQFAASLRQTSEGKYIMSDLSPQERMHISRFTGLSMTTISHWLANVKYQLRRTGGTKFLKNLDTGHPVFFCNDCASQIRTPSTYISHLESHLGFRLRDLSKLSTEQINNQIAQTKSPSEKLVTSSPEEDLGTSYQCKLCNRTFASKHAVKLHLSKTHGKSPEDHLLYVSELEKQ